MVSWAAVFWKVSPESIIFNRKAIHKKVDYSDFIIGVNGLVQRNREKINLCSVMSLDEFHVVKVQNTTLSEESPAPELLTTRVGF